MPVLDLVGQTFGRLKVIKRGENTKRGQARWICECECGNIKTIIGGSLKNHQTKSCGCLWKERIIEANSISIFERLEKYIDKSSGEWLWTGFVNRNGYGRIGYKGKLVLAHRLVYTLYKGIIPDGMCVLHGYSDNKLNVTPENLWLGSHKQNSDDMIEKGRDNKAIGEKNGNSELVTSEILEIRELYKTGGYSYRELGTKYNVVHSTIGSIIRKKTWVDTQ